MKKLIALLLVAVMCLSFVACNKSTDNEECTQCAKYKGLIELLESEKYKEAIIEIYELAENGSNNSNNSETNQQTEVIGITLDNWQEYFEIKHFVGKDKEDRNAFGELIKFYPTYGLVLKEKWQNKIVDSDVQVEYSCTDSYRVWFNYNTDTQELIKGERYGTASDEDQVKQTLSWNYNPSERVYAQFSSSCLPSTFVMDGNIAKIVGRDYTNTEIHRIQGSLTVTK